MFIGLLDSGNGGDHMLAVSSDKYTIPIKAEPGNDELCLWKMRSRLNDHEFLTHNYFNYTFIREIHVADDDPQRFNYTFTYDNHSVKAAPRTLRLLGAVNVQRIVSLLSQCVSVDWSNKAFDEIMTLLTEFSVNRVRLVKGDAIGIPEDDYSVPNQHPKDVMNPY